MCSFNFFIAINSLPNDEVSTLLYFFESKYVEFEFKINKKIIK